MSIDFGLFNDIAIVNNYKMFAFGAHEQGRIILRILVWTQRLHKNIPTSKCSPIFENMLPKPVNFKFSITSCNAFAIL